MALRRAIVRATLASARLISAAIRNRRGLPACHCAAHGGSQLPGLSPPCLCTAATGAGVNAACPHVTLRHVRIRKHPTLSLYFVPVDNRAWDVLDAAERSECADVDDAPYETADEQD
jgi:hypothetical protein